MKKLLLQQLQDDQVPGALVYVNHPKLGRWSAALGSSDLNGAPLDIASYMRIGSVTKTLTATAVLQLVDKGLVGLDDPIERYLPGVVPNGGAITVRQLFNNTEDLGLNEALDAKPFQAFSPQQSIDIAFEHEPYFEPGTGWHYSNTNYIVLGLLLEQMTGMSVSDIFKQWIFAPLKMKRSVMPVGESAEMPNPHPRGYLFGTNVDSLKVYEALLKGDEKGSAVRVPQGVPPQDATDWNPYYTWTSGNAISTLSDIATWAKALATGALLSPKLHKQQLEPTRLPDGGVISYGLGITEVLPACESRKEVIPRFIGHNGAVPGFQSLVGYSPETGGTIVVLTNSEIAPNTPLLKALPADNLAKIIQQHVFLRRVNDDSRKPDHRCVTPFIEAP